MTKEDIKTVELEKPEEKAEVSEVDALKRGARQKQRPTYKKNSQGKEITASKRDNKTPDNETKCWKCGYSHERKKCPAFGSTCYKCEKPNHWAKMCKSDETTAKAADLVTTANVTEQENLDDLFVDELTARSRKEWILPMQLEGTKMPVKVDTRIIKAVNHSSNSTKAFTQKKKKYG